MPVPNPTRFHRLPFADACTAFCWIAAVILGVPGLVAADSATTADPALARRPWFELRSEAFCAYTTGPTQDVLKALARLEQFRYCYGQLAGAQAVASPPIQVYAFENSDDFTPFKTLYKGRPANVGGYFMRRQDALIIAFSLAGNLTNTFELLFHEYTHFLLRKNHFWPPWLTEGMAELYSTLEMRGDTVWLGRPPPGRLRLLEEGPLLPLSQLFAVKHDSPEYNENDKQGLFYAQSWLLAHYLAVGTDAARRKRFGDYTRLLRDGLSPEVGFTKALGSPITAIEKELKAYLERGEFRPLTLQARSQLRVSVSQRRLGVPETSFLLGHLLLQLDRAAEARPFFEEARRLQPKSPFGYQGLGLLAVHENRTDDAIRELAHARQLGSRHHLTHYRLGWERLMQLKDIDGNFRRLPPEKAAQLAEVRAPLQEAVRLMPSFAPAQYSLGFLELVQHEDLPAAERHLAAAHRMAPDLSYYGITLARAYIAQRKQEPARELLEELSKTASTKEAKAEATRLLEQWASDGRQR